jgi:16S rRNA (adenine1518-N6/adenine1519-N6)-dimethyltransferase
MAFQLISQRKLLQVCLLLFALPSHVVDGFTGINPNNRHSCSVLPGWEQRTDGEWTWQEDDPSYVAPATAVSLLESSSATPQLPSGSYKPKQSLGQNYLKDPNTVAKILRTFHKDATRDQPTVSTIVELGPGAGALTDRLVETYSTDILQVIEIDERSVQLLQTKHPALRIRHEDVLQVDYATMAQEEGQPLVVIGNLPYYITSQILFALADASHSGAVSSATVTMQWEVAQRMVADCSTKDYGILSVVFQLYANVKCHFKIPPTVFYPQPKVNSALLGLHFLGPARLRARLAGVDPIHLRRVVTTAFRQRRKTVRNSLKGLCREICSGDAERAQALLDSEPLPLPDTVREAQNNGDAFALCQELPSDWATKRPEEFTSGQFVEITRLLFGPKEFDEESCRSTPLGRKVWRKLKHGD